MIVAAASSANGTTADYFRDAKDGTPNMPDDDDKRDDLVMRWLDSLEAREKARLDRAREDEAVARVARETVVNQARRDVSNFPSHLAGMPEAISLDALERLVRARLEIDLVTAPHEAARSAIDQQIDEIRRIGDERARLLSDRMQRENLRIQSENVRIQRILAVTAVVSAIVAAVAIVVSLLSRC